MRHRWVALILLLVIGLSSTPVRAETVEVNPENQPNISLEPAEAGKLAALQGAVFPRLLTDVSPDDKSILTYIRRGVAPTLSFVNVEDGSAIPVANRVRSFPPLTETRWRNDHTAVYVSEQRRVGAVLVSLARDTGAVVTTSLKLSGFPLSLAPNASRLLVAQLPTEDNQGLNAQSPFSLELRRTPRDWFGVPRFDADRSTLMLSRAAVVISSLDLESGELTYLFSLPEGTFFASAPAWTQDGAKVAFVRTTIPFSIEGNRLLDKATQDALGELAPTDNPFFEDNIIDIVDFGKHDTRLGAIKANDGNGDIFSDLSWSTDEQTLLVQVTHPAKLSGRRYPTYLFPDRSYVRFYSASGQLLGTFDRPEIEAPSQMTARFVSPDEVIFNAPYGLSYRLYYYNRVSGEFRQFSFEDGTYYQMRSTHQSRRLIFSFSSFKKPYEVYRIGWDGNALAQLTFHNAEIPAINQIRVDQVTFTLRNGSKRTGYILQPAAAAFPPRNVRMVVWQQGGPGVPMTNEWGGNVEQPFDLLPNFGIALLVLPLTGREGYGPAFYSNLANDRNFGAIDIDEGAQVVQQMIARGYTSPKSVGITGCSYGGYFTSQSITRYPNLYAAANTQCTLLDLFHEWQLNFTLLISYLEGRAPTADPAEYIRDSPVYNATKVRTPLLIFDGVYDFLPVAISGNFHDQVAASKTPVRFLKFDGEGHGLQQVNSQLVAGQAQIQWFRQYLDNSGR